MTALPLNYKLIHSPNHSKPTIIILHGLLGSLRNWQMVSVDLSNYFDIYLIDQRNHGDSPHSDEIDHALMLEDLSLFFESHIQKPVYLMGHSLGGKIAMNFACQYPEKLKGLIAVDIAPENYFCTFKNEITALLELPIHNIKDRKQFDLLLAPKIQDTQLRQFLLSNLSRDKNQNFYWKPNLKALLNNLSLLCSNSLEEHMNYKGPTLFIKGEKSNYIQEKHTNILQKHFPEHSLITISNAGHNVHTDNKIAFIEAVKKFATI